MADEQTETPAEPLLTTRQAAEHVGKTYKQWTAYVHTHAVPKVGDPPRYRLSDVQKEAARIQGRARGPRPLSLAPITKTDETEQNRPSAGDGDASLQRLETVLGRLAVAQADKDRLSGRVDELHERLHSKEAQHRAEIDRLRTEYEARLEAERQRQAQTPAARLGWWDRLLGRKP